MKDNGPYTDDLDLALNIVDYVDGVTMADFGSLTLRVETKADDSPVTDVDRAAEHAVRELLERHRPHDAIHGEEFGTKGGGPRQWVIDPVDGTRNYVRGIPVWATLIALLDEGEPVMGVVSAPALGLRWFASKGEGAWKGRHIKDATRIHVSDRDAMGDSTMSYSSLVGWEKIGLLPAFLDLTRKLWRTRAFGDFWSYMMVAEGTVEIATEPDLQIYDMAALVTIVEEAGGKFTSLDGTRAPFGGNALATNGLLHSAALAALRPPAAPPAS
jgi:histidinol-phosphatase